MNYLPKLLAGALLALAFADPAPAQSDRVAVLARPADDTFMLLREAAQKNDSARAALLAGLLPNYEMAQYVEYYRLKPRLRTASPDEVRDFLRRHDGSAIAERLRLDWLAELGRARDWTNFDQQLALLAGSDDLQVRCYALMSRHAKGENVAPDARKLLLHPPSYGDACGALVAALAQSGQFGTDDLLFQLRLAGEMDATGPSRRTALLLGASDTRAAQAVDYPALAMARGVGGNASERAIYLVAIGRMARTSLRLAVVALEKNAPGLTPVELATGWAGIAHAASLALDPEAHEYWRRANGARLSNEQIQWKTRTALRRHDWATVRDTIAAMPPQLSNDPAWTYWHARALQALNGGVPRATAAMPGNGNSNSNGNGNGNGQPDPIAMYRSIVDQNSFYGQLALEALGQRISIPPPGPPVTAAEVDAMAANPGLRRALRFFKMRMRAEGAREWNWELRKFSERELLAAAEFARQNDILDRMVNTSERTRTMFDYTQRFPSPHIEILHPTTQDLGLDKSWVYGLIRQESRFMLDARSSAGASGLMQVMPSTGDYVARKLGLDYVKDKLTDLRTNIVLGANYMNMVLERADGSQPVATAAYNAGPGRPKRWRASLAEPVEGAIFAETIPFMETRIYVKNVMSNATNYAALFENRPQSLKARLGVVTPGPRGNNDLP
ncbi:lytic transglycosylase domain-containing protein [Massilia cavernae]|uniref:Lytic transglycosylase domain-containing protein n=1 Tax=Massilia cavernae TaxID=2320864 RepID=A0A418XQF0_9BURK|nr:lytic transglycosylase domain-containing protein [Massilia cavernae]RJG14733.1 lytic transglycosylase domain-containing protein [Massilia cavernae]